MSTTTQSLSGFYGQNFRSTVNLSMRDKEEEYSRVLQVLTSTEYVERFKAWAGLGLATQKAELGPVTFQDPTELGIREYTHTTHAIGFKVSYEAAEDDKYGVVNATSASIGDSLKESAEIYFANVWNNAFAADATPVLTVDGLSIINDAHDDLAGGPVQDNNFAADVSLGLLQSARYHFNNLRNAKGLRDTGHSIERVIISSDATTEPMLDQILGGLALNQQPFTADRTTHELQGTNPVKQVYHYLTDTDRTIILSNKALSQDGGPMAIWRRRPSTSEWDDDAIMGMCFVGSFRGSYGCVHWRGTAGSTGV